MSNTTLFDFEVHEVRVVTIEGEPWLLAKDVCAVLGLRHIHKATAPLAPDEKGRKTLPTPGGLQQMVIVSESGPTS